MGVAKVTLNGSTLMDTTGMTVTSSTMVNATTALDKAGEVVTGTIATKTSNDITVNGSTITVPAGAYSTATTKSVASAAAFAPAVTLASSTGVVTGTNTFTAGYYSASTKTSTLNLITQAAKTVTPTETAQTAVASYRWTTGNVQVAAISSDYVGTNITQRTSTDLTANGSTVTVPVGYYATQATKNVTSATAFAPAVTIASATGVVTGTNTFTAGYYVASTKTSTLNLTTQAGKTVTPTEAAQVAVSSYRWTTGIVSVAAISSNYVGTNITRRTATDLTANLSTVTAPAGYYSSQVTKNVTSASAFAPAVTLNSSTGVITGTNTFTSAYYAASTKTSTLNLTIKAAQTYTPTTTAQYISSYRWLTGSQTILGDTNLVPSNIASGVSIFGVTGTHQGSTPNFHTAYLIANSTYSLRSTSITYNNVVYSFNTSKYYSTFSFQSGETILAFGSYSYTDALESIALVFYYNGERLSYSPVSGSYTYTWTLPNNDVYIHAMYNGGFDVYDNENDYWLNRGPISAHNNGFTWYWLYSSNVKYIPHYKFMSTSGLTSVSLSQALGIGSHAFDHCYSINYIDLPKVTVIDQYAFVSCSALTEASIYDCSIISGSAFQSCSGLTTVHGSNITDIKINGFAGCNRLSDINTAQVINLGQGAFGYCSSLTNLSLPNIQSLNSVMFVYAGIQSIYLGSNLSAIIPEAAFRYATKLSTISGPGINNITTISTSAFEYCGSLTTISFPNAQLIEASGFARCSYLTEIILPKIQSISGRAFYSCYKLISVNLTQVTSVPTLSTSVFTSTPIGGYSVTAGQYGSVFVPASLYNSFITTTNWVAISSRIVSV